jgi:deoxycytidylate deaminase
MNKWIERASQEALKAPGYGTVKIAAVLVHRNKLISIGYNSTKSHPLQKLYGRDGQIYLHAEIDAIRKALRRHDSLEGMQLYVSRWKWKDKDKTCLVEGMCKPCNGCQSAIEDFGIQVIHYTKDIENETYDAQTLLL